MTPWALSQSTHGLYAADTGHVIVAENAIKARLLHLLQRVKAASYTNNLAPGLLQAVLEDFADKLRVLNE